MEESETTPMGERKTMQQGGDLGENGRAMEVVAPLYMMGRFRHVLLGNVVISKISYAHARSC